MMMILLLCIGVYALLALSQAVQMFESSGGLEGLEGLEYNSNDMLREQADSILDVFFYKEDKQVRRGRERLSAL